MKQKDILWQRIVEKAYEGTASQVHDKKIIPTRQELIGVYKYISAVKNITLDNLFMKISGDSMNYCKLHICVDIFRDKGLIEFRPATMKNKLQAAETKKRTLKLLLS